MRDIAAWGDMLESRVAKLEFDVECIKRDIGEIKPDIKSIDGRLTGIEASIISAKTTVNVVVIVGIFAVCIYFFVTYISNVVDALNAIVLK